MRWPSWIRTPTPQRQGACQKTSRFLQVILTSPRRPLCTPEDYHSGMFSKRVGLGLAILLFSTAATEAGQAPPTRALTADDYARAERFMPYNAAPLMLHGGVRATWLADGRFWYRTTTEKGVEAFLIDPATGN